MNDWKELLQELQATHTFKVAVSNEVGHQSEQEKQSFEDDEEAEFERMVREFEPLGFSSSREVSNYIKASQLGRKYPLLTGVMTFEHNDNSWEYEGGIAPRWYAQLCRRLGLGNQASGARVTAFSRYKDRL